MVSITWPESGRAVFERHPAARRTRAGLVNAIAKTAHSEWWAIDVPFGWPNGWGDFLLRHSRGPANLPGAGPGEERPWRSVARRATDLVVIDRTFDDGRRSTPGFSVSFDKLGATAAAWASIEWELADQHDMIIDRSGTGDRIKVCETYPAAAWRKWFESDNPSSAGTDTFREAMKEVLEPADGNWHMTGHERDAVVCAMVARARALNATHSPSEDQHQAAAIEGWIHLQRDDISLSNLA